jgi:hypothetical protein
MATNTHVITAVVRISADTSTGTQDITTSDLGGLVPKAAIFICSVGVTDGTPAADFNLSYGAVDGTRQWCTSSNTADSLGSTDTYSTTDTDKCIRINTAGTPTIDGDAEFTSFITNGVRINWLNAPSSAWLVTVILFTGEGITAHANAVGLGNSVDNSVDVTSPGFEPTVIFTACQGDLAADDGQTHVMPSFGLVHNGDSVVQRSAAWNIRNGASNGSPDARCTESYGIMQVTTLAALDWGGEFGTFDSSGFTVITRNAGANSTTLFYLALKLSPETAWLGTVDTPTSAGNDSITGVGFVPDTVIQLGTHMPAIDTAYNSSPLAGVIGIGAFSKTGKQFMTSVADEDGVTTTNTQSLSDNVAVELPQDDGTTGLTATHVSMGLDGWTHNYTNVLGSARKFFVLAIEAQFDTQTHVLDAVLKTEAITQTHILDAGLQAEATAQTHILDMILKDVAFTQPHLLDMVLKAEATTQSHILDVVLKTEAITRTYILDAILQAESTQSHVLDAILQAEGTTQTHILDAVLQEPSVTTKIHLLDAVLKTEAITQTHVLDAVLKTEAIPRTHLLITGLIGESTAKTHSLISVLEKANSSVYEILAILQAEATTQTYVLDATLQAEATTQTHILDAILQVEVTAQTHVLDVVLKTEAITRTHVLDTVLQAEATTQTHVLDAVLKTEAITQTHVLDAVLKTEAITRTHVLDAGLRAEATTQTYLLDAVLQAEAATQTHVLDAVLKTEAITRTHVLDAGLRAEAITRTHVLDAGLRAEATTQTHILDVTLQLEVITLSQSHILTLTLLNTSAIIKTLTGDIKVRTW